MLTKKINKQLSSSLLIKNTEEYIKLSKTQLSSEQFIDFLLSNICLYHSRNVEKNNAGIELAVFCKSFAEILKTSDQLDLSLRYFYISLDYFSINTNNKVEIDNLKNKIKLIEREKELDSLIINGMKKKEEGLFLEAIGIFNKANELATKLYEKKINNKFFLIYSNLGECYEAEKDLPNSLNFYKRGFVELKIIDQDNNQAIIALSKKIAFNYIKSGQYHKANQLLSTIVKTYHAQYGTYINNYIANLLYKISLIYKESNYHIMGFKLAIKAFQISAVYPDDNLHTKIEKHLISSSAELISLEQFKEITLEFLLKKISVSVSDPNFTNGDCCYNLCEEYIKKSNKNAYEEQLLLYKIFKLPNPLSALEKIFSESSELIVITKGDSLYLKLIETASSMNIMIHPAKSSDNDLIMALSFFFIKELVEESSNIAYFIKEILHINYITLELLNNKALWAGIHFTSSILGAKNIPDNIINYKQLLIILTSSTIFTGKLYWNDYLINQHKLELKYSQHKSIEGVNDFIEQCAPSMALQAALFYSNSLTNAINLPLLHLVPAIMVSADGIKCYKTHNPPQHNNQLTTFKTLPYIFDAIVASKIIKYTYNIDAMNHNHPVKKFFYIKNMAFLTLHTVIAADYLSKLAIYNIEEIIINPAINYAGKCYNDFFKIDSHE